MTSFDRSQYVFCIPSIPFLLFELLFTFCFLSITIFLKTSIMRKTLLLSLLATTASSQSPPLQDPSKVKDVVASAITSLSPTPGTLTFQILQTFLTPISTLLARNSHVYRNGTNLYLNGERWTASGANVYWLGLDENVEPPPGEPYYAPLKASYPTKGRTTEIMRTLVTMGAKLIRSQTLGVSVGNPLSLMPVKGVVNTDAFEAIDWAVFQARQHGLRIIAPLVDNFVSLYPVSFQTRSSEHDNGQRKRKRLTAAGLLPRR